MLLVDPAVGSNDLVEPLRALGLDVQASPIDADIAFEGRGIGGTPVTIGVEYKKLHELVQALRTERLQGHQLIKMQAFDFRWLLIEGEVLLEGGYLARRVGRNRLKRLEGSMTYHELTRRLLTMQIAAGLQWVIVDDREQTLKFIETLYRTWTDVDQDAHKSHIAIYEPAPLIPVSQFRRTVATLPGVGLTLSQRVEDYFPHLREAFSAAPAVWAQIDGIGTKTATKIVEAILKS